MKQASISFMSFDDKTSCVIASLPQRSDVQVIYFDKVMGSLLFTGINGYDVFVNKEAALKFVTMNKKVVNAIDAHSILGYIYSTKCCYLLLVEKARPIISIFDHHMVYAIEKVSFIEIPIEMPNNEINSVQIDKVKNYPFENAHFFCPTFDLSRLIGKSTINRNCWNLKLKYPFERIPLSNLCISLYQGIIRYTPFTQLNVGIMFISSHTFPQIIPDHYNHIVSENSTSHDYTVDVYLIRNLAIENFEVLCHSIQFGDFPFNWISQQGKILVGQPEVNTKAVSTFVSKTLEFYDYNYLTFFNFMSDKTNPEYDLTCAMDTALSTLYKNTEQITVEWSHSKKDITGFNMFVQCFFPFVKANVQKHGFSKCLMANDKSTILSKQTGTSRILFTNTFEKESLGLFFYILIILEKMCHEFKFPFPDSLITTDNLKSFPKGFVYFTANFVLELSYSISKMDNIFINDLQDVIYTYMNPPSIDFSSYQINPASLISAIDVLRTFSIVQNFAVSQSASSFVYSPKTVGNAILHLHTGYTEIPNDEPLIICLNEPCFVREIILKNTNAISVSVFGGLKLNRTFPIKKNISIPWPLSAGKNTPSTDFVRINLASNAFFYDHNIRPNEIEKVRFVILKFKCFRDEPLKIGGVFAYGVYRSPFNPNLINTKETPKKKFHLNTLTSVKYEGDLKTDTYVKWEIQRLLQNESYFELQKDLIAKNMPIDTADFNAILLPYKTSVEKDDSKKHKCTKCRVKGFCYECMKCNKIFCSNCLIKLMQDQRTILKICQSCKQEREQLLNTLVKLRTLQYYLINELYPFISLHNDQSLITFNQNSIQSINQNNIKNNNELNFGLLNGINKPMISAFVNEPPLPPHMTICPENLFISDVDWPISSNFLQLNIVFTCNSKINGLQISCSAPLKVQIEGATPKELLFDNFGGIQKVDYVGRMAKLTLCGAKVELRHIHFLGKPYLEENLNFLEKHPNDSSAIKKRGFLKVDPQSAHFNIDFRSHEIRFDVPTEICALMFGKDLPLPKELILEMRNANNEINIIHRNMASLAAPEIAMVVMPNTALVVSLRVFYPNIAHNLIPIYKKNWPELVSCQAPANKK